MLSCLALSVLVASSCSSGADAEDGGYQFVSPGGEPTILYDPPATRGKVDALAGESLTEPGRQLSTADYTGDVVVLNVWGSWCPPCRVETDDLESAYTATKDLGVRFLGINVRDDNRSAAEDFVANHQVSYPSLYDPPGRSLLVLEGFPRSVVPATIVLDRQHRVAAVFLTALLEEDLLPVVRRIAEESA